MSRHKDISAELDVMIVGGGVAGLWLLNRLVAERYTVGLIEKGELGGGQTVHSQGIIHGGMKYTLGGGNPESADALSGMPALWRDCLTGHGEINLTSVPVGSDSTYMWSEGSLVSRLTSFFASRALRSRVAALGDEEKPPAFRKRGFSGTIYRLDECVVDVPGLVRTLATPHAGRIFRLDAAMADFTEDGAFEWTLPNARVRIKARRVVMTAGQGFDDLTRLPGLTGFLLQKRPLHMVMLEHDCALPVFGHCIGKASTPLLTITSHPAGNGRHVWYLGGGLAEEGVALEPDEQILAAKAALARCIPWLDLGRRRWRTVRIDRAEASQPGNARPAGPFVAVAGKFIVAWPTKLALAPLLARRVMALLPEPTGMPDMTGELGDVPLPNIAEAPWERLFK